MGCPSLGFRRGFVVKWSRREDRRADRGVLEKAPAPIKRRGCKRWRNIRRDRARDRGEGEIASTDAEIQLTHFDAENRQNDP